MRQKCLCEDPDEEDRPLLTDDSRHYANNASMDLSVAPNSVNESNFHCHANAQRDAEERRQSRKRVQKKLMIASACVIVFMTLEFAGGFFSNSMAIMTDAVHMFSDFINLGIALLSTRLGFKASTATFTQGFQRFEALGALATVVLIWDMSAFIVYNSVKRLMAAEYEVHSTAMVIVAAVAIVFNVFLILFFRGLKLGHSHGGGSQYDHFFNEDDNHNHSHNDGENLNLRAATVHVLGDVIMSCGVLVASLVIYFVPAWAFIDPICSLVLCFVVIFTTIGVTRDSAKILLEARPASVDYDVIRKALEDADGAIERVHDLRIWWLSSDRPIVSVHLAVKSGLSDVERNKILNKAVVVLRTKNVKDSTIQIETYDVDAWRGCRYCITDDVSSGNDDSFASAQAV